MALQDVSGDQPVLSLPSLLATKYDLCLTKRAQRYRRCARLCLELDDIQKAKEYAQKELDVEEAILGTDTDHLREDLVGAKYWLEYLENLV